MFGLSDWLALEKISGRALSALLGKSPCAVHRYCAGRVPKQEVVAEIFRISGGRVEPNDLYHFDGLKEFLAARAALVDSALAVAEKAAPDDCRELVNLAAAAKNYSSVVAALETVKAAARVPEAA